MLYFADFLSESDQLRIGRMVLSNIAVHPIFLDLKMIALVNILLEYLIASQLQSQVFLLEMNHHGNHPYHLEISKLTLLNFLWHWCHWFWLRWNNYLWCLLFLILWYILGWLLVHWWFNYLSNKRLLFNLRLYCYLICVLLYDIFFGFSSLLEILFFILLFMNLLLLYYLLIFRVRCWSRWNKFVLWLLLHNWLRWRNWFKLIWKLASKLLVWLLALIYNEL